MEVVFSFMSLSKSNSAKVGHSIHSLGPSGSQSGRFSALTHTSVIITASKALLKLYFVLIVNNRIFVNKHSVDKTELPLSRFLCIYVLNVIVFFILFSPHSENTHST